MFQSSNDGKSVQNQSQKRSRGRPKGSRNKALPANLLLLKETSAGMTLVNERTGTERIYLSAADIQSLINVSRSTIWRWEADGTLPKAMERFGKKLFRTREVLRCLGY